MAVITISREMGSGGKSVARRVADALGYDCADKTLIVDIAREIGVSEASVEQLDERDGRGDSSFRSWLRGLMMSADPVFTSEATPAFWPMLRDPALGRTQSPIPYGEHVLNREEYREMLATIVNRLNARGNVVILGRGGQGLLANEKKVVHVRIVAPFEVRCKRVTARDEISLSEARKRVRQTDQARARYLKNCYRIDGADPLLYHLVLNTGLWSLEQATQVIVEAVRAGA